MKSKWLFLILIFLISCQAQTAVPEPPAESVENVVVEEVAVEATAPPVEPEQPTAVPTIAQAVEETVTEEPTPLPATPTPAPTEEPVVEANNFLETGRTDLGAYYLGSPNAPIRMIDYSDFL